MMVDTRLSDEEQSAEFTSVLDSAPQMASSSLSSQSVVPVQTELPSVETPWMNDIDPVAGAVDPGGRQAAGLSGDGGDGSGSVGFFPAAARGNRSVYVVYASGSLPVGVRFLRCRAELLRTLLSFAHALTFCVISFTDRTHPPH